MFCKIFKTAATLPYCARLAKKPIDGLGSLKSEGLF
jgi:hypothetical protein